MTSAQTITDLAEDFNAAAHELLVASEKQALLTTELCEAALAYSQWNEYPGREWTFVRAQEGKLTFRSSVSILTVTAEELADARQKLDAPRATKSRWSRLCKEWLEATGITPTRVRYESHTITGVSIQYWYMCLVGGQQREISDICGIPWEFFSVRGLSARAAFARSHDDEYTDYRCRQCGSRVHIENTAGSELPETLERDCTGSHSSCRGQLRQLTRASLLDDFQSFPMPV